MQQPRATKMSEMSEIAMKNYPERTLTQPIMRNEYLLVRIFRFRNLRTDCVKIIYNVIRIITNLILPLFTWRLNTTLLFYKNVTHCPRI
jgi:hypothetical protein